MQKIGDAAAPSAEQWLRADGVSVPVEATASVVPWKGGLAKLVILRDVSERAELKMKRRDCWRTARTGRWLSMPAG